MAIANPQAIDAPKAAKPNVVAVVVATKAARVAIVAKAVENKIKGEAIAMHANNAAANLNAPRCSSWTLE